MCLRYCTILHLFVKAPSIILMHAYFSCFISFFPEILSHTLLGALNSLHIDVT